MRPGAIQVLKEERAATLQRIFVEGDAQLDNPRNRRDTADDCDCSPAKRQRRGEDDRPFCHSRELCFQQSI